MARPWRKRSAWQYVAKSGKRSYRVGFYDHDKRERTKSFPSAGHAREWIRDYITDERRGRDSLRRFLLDLDAKEATEAEGRTIAEIVELFLETDAHPRNEVGLAPATYDHYTSTLNSHLLGKPSRTPGSGRRVPVAHYAIAIAQTPAEQFSRPQAPRAWREQMRQAGVPSSTRVRAWGGAKPSRTPAIQPATRTSSFPGISPAAGRACSTQQQARCTSAKRRPRSGAKHASRRRYAPSPMLASSAPPRTRCAAAASPYACAPRTPKSSPASAAPA
jgi:hypothetical protein